MAKNEVILGIKKLGWSAIQLTQKSYRGAVQVFKSTTGDKVPVMFYIDEAFVIEDKDGLFAVQDLKDFFMTKKNVDLEATGCIEGLSLVAFVQDGAVGYSEAVLDRLHINTIDVRQELNRRLSAVSQLGELETVDMGF